MAIQSIIAIGGPQASGKTTLAETLKPELEKLGHKVLWLDSDKERRDFLASPQQSLIDARTRDDPNIDLSPEIHFTEEVNADFQESMREKAKQVLKNGCTVIVSSTLLRSSERARWEELATNATLLDRAVFVGLFLYPQVENPDKFLITRMEGREAERIQRVKEGSAPNPKDFSGVGRRGEHSKNLIRRSLNSNLGKFSSNWHTLDAAHPSETILCEAMLAITKSIEEQSHEYVIQRSVSTQGGLISPEVHPTEAEIDRFRRILGTGDGNQLLNAQQAEMIRRSAGEIGRLFKEAQKKYREEAGRLDQAQPAEPKKTFLLPKIQGRG